MMGGNLPFLVVKGLPERFRLENVEIILILLLVVPIIAACVIALIRYRKQFTFCPHCRSRTEIIWRTEKIDTAKARNIFRNKGIIFYSGVQKIPVIHCPGCGWKTDLRIN